MYSLALVGPYPKGVYEQIRGNLPMDWNITCIETQQELDECRDLVYVILRTHKMNADLINANPNLCIIQRWGVGYDTVDIDAAGKRGIPVTIAANINSHSVAEHTIALMLSSLRNIVPMAVFTMAGAWDRISYAEKTYMLSEKKIGLLGCGAIGKKVAELSSALGAKLSYYDSCRLSEVLEKQMGLTYLPLDEIFSQSDIISLHMPLTDQTKNIVNKTRINLMKPTALLINTARGGLIDEIVLAEALTNGKIFGAALDCLSEEPYPIDGCLRGVPNLLLTPHVGGTAVELNLYMARRVCENVLKVARGQPLQAIELVNKELCGYKTE